MPPRAKRLTTTGGAAVGGLLGGAAGAALGELLQPDDEGRRYQAGRVLALIALAAPDAMAATATQLAQGRGVVVERVAPLPLTDDGLVIYRIVDGRSVMSKVVLFRTLPAIRGAWPDYVYNANACGDSQPQPASFQYGLRLIRADRLATTTTGRGVSIAIIDTGLDPAHEALRGGVADTVDLTGNGFTPDVHGTMVAGVMAARPTAMGMLGLAPEAQLVAIKACTPRRPQEPTARCLSSDLAIGVDLAVARQVRIINLSVAGPEDALLSRVIAAAVRTGVFVVAAAGNGGRRARPAYPGALNDVIAVTAVDAGANLYRSANRGDYIDVAAPGVDVVTLGPRNQTVVTSGTSIATAYVTATVALLVEAGANGAPPSLRQILEGTARDLGRAGRDRDFGYGLLDVCRAVERIKGPLAACGSR
jgi:subtilisin family serine protease